MTPMCSDATPMSCSIQASRPRSMWCGAKRKAPPEERRAFLRNPRPAIAEALAVEGQDTTSLFIETTQYSDRVEGLGVWADIKTAPSKGSTGWLPEKFDGGAPAPQVVDAENIEEIAGAVERARAAGEDADRSRR